ncbi:alpha/beta-Hydrolase [Glarea lozoyensis ATCC 20868]|uniref:1-alkyl-2-acetylglycerophosphocholine esterase n=1 Tax=Glarea lozoyensis (strain ATCC 20868 / MF5171) TaxID=1116229 RepID=S3D435_GLAL2|nr:alpha/beta-Hydrolase [Glarea lozoyensis ATCC 20868]EPE32580.1 alpha/beta-Hydrolase [Glarea lozoyensis ATCC 20868]
MLLPLLFLPFSFATILIPPPTGKYGVSLTNIQLVDKTRPDPWGFDTIANRRIVVSRFDPVAPRSCRTKQRIPYMTSVVAEEEDRILGPYEWPVGVLGQLELELCVPKNKVVKDAPVVLFSPGGNTTRFYYSALASEIASRGYSVITIDHPFETDIVEFDDGTIAYGGHYSARKNLTFAETAVSVRAADMSFVLDTLGLKDRKKDKAAAFGHSFGGAATAAAMRLDPRIRGGVNLDGLLYGEVVQAGFGEKKNSKQSFVLWGAQGHNSTEDPDWNSFWSALGEQNVWKRELSLLGGAHGAFWDLNLIADVANVRGQFGQYTEEDLISKLPGKRVYQIVGDYLDDYLKFVFEGGSEGLLKGPNKKYPEVDFL